MNNRLQRILGKHGIYPAVYETQIPETKTKLAWINSKYNSKSSHSPNKRQQDLLSIPCYSIIKHCVHKYFSSTTLHGCRYIVDSNTPLVDKIVIGSLILFTAVNSVLVMKAQLMNLYHTTILMTMESSPTSITDIPFPAITICPLSQIRSFLFNYTELLDKLPDQLSAREKTQLDYGTYLCYNREEKGYFSRLDAEYLQSIFKIQRKYCKADVEELHWLGRKMELPCCYLQPMLSHRGICHTFNMLPMNQLLSDKFTSNFRKAFQDAEYKLENFSSSWSPDNGYKDKSSTLTSLPWRALGAQQPNSAEFILNFDASDFDDSCTLGSKGFEVFIHLPLHSPSKSEPYIYVDVGENMLVNILPRITKTTKNLRNWPPRERNCYYENERKLYFFKYYTQQNCDKECEANATLANCGCVAFYHPREELTPICGADLESCIYNTSVNSLTSKSLTGSGCNCLPGCFEIKYSFSTLSFGKKLNINTNNTDPRSVQSRIEIVFKRRRVTAFLKTTLFSASELIANFGGVMSLCIGFSIVSLLEIVYFMTLRLLTNIWNYNRHQLE